MKYIIEGKYLESKKAMEWMRDNEGVFVESSNNCSYVYKEGYFKRYIFKSVYYYTSLPRSDFELSVTTWVDDIVRHESDSWSKQWCPVQ